MLAHSDAYTRTHTHTHTHTHTQYTCTSTCTRILEAPSRRHALKCVHTQSPKKMKGQGYTKDGPLQKLFNIKTQLSTHISLAHTPHTHTHSLAWLCTRIVLLKLQEGWFHLSWSPSEQCSMAMDIIDLSTVDGRH